MQIILMEKVVNLGGLGDSGGERGEEEGEETKGHRGLRAALD